VLVEGAGTNAVPLDISHDKKLLVYSATGSSTKDDLWFLPLEGNHTPMKYLDGPADERQAQFSPDDKWIAYASDESSDQYQVFLQSIPPGKKWQVSKQGGSRPRWRKDGKELYYVSADQKMMAVPIKIGLGTVDIGTPRQLFSFPTLAIPNPREIGYEPSPDGQRFLVLIPSEQQADSAQSAIVSINWMSIFNR